MHSMQLFSLSRKEARGRLWQFMAPPDEVEAGYMKPCSSGSAGMTVSYGYNRAGPWAPLFLLTSITRIVARTSCVFATMEPLHCQNWGAVYSCGRVCPISERGQTLMGGTVSGRNMKRIMDVMEKRNLGEFSGEELCEKGELCHDGGAMDKSMPRPPVKITLGGLCKLYTGELTAGADSWTYMRGCQEACKNSDGRGI